MAAFTNSTTLRFLRALTAMAFFVLPSSCQKGDKVKAFNATTSEDHATTAEDPAKPN